MGDQVVVGERVAIIDALANSSRGLTVSQLVGLLGASDSQVRRLLSGLAAAGAVSTLKDDPTGPGRPTLRFRLAPPSGGWPELVQMLVVLVTRIAEIDSDDIAVVGRERGAALARGEFPDGVVEVQARLGFAPRDVSTRQDERDQARRLNLQSCPYRDAVLSEGGRAICALHKGLAEGMSTALGGHVDVFEVRDPITAGCEIRLRRGQPACA
jgi:predicted ArsR family transcriptional regulator